MQDPVTVAQLARIKKEVARICGDRSPFHIPDHPLEEAKLIRAVIPGKTSRYDLTKLEASEVIDALRLTPSPQDLKARAEAEAAALPPCTPEDPCTFCGAVGDDEHECTDCGAEIKDCRTERTCRCGDCEAALKLS